MSDNNIDSEGDSQKFVKTWAVEWSSTLGKSVTEERMDYSDALRIFNEKSQGGIDAILYEIQKSISDGSLIKKIPVLNTKKAKQREEARRMREQTHKEKKSTRLADTRLRIVILAAAVAVLVVILFVLSNMTNSLSPADSNVEFLVDSAVKQYKNMHAHS